MSACHSWAGPRTRLQLKNRRQGGPADESMWWSRTPPSDHHRNSSPSGFTLHGAHTACSIEYVDSWSCPLDTMVHVFDRWGGHLIPALGDALGSHLSKITFTLMAGPSTQQVLLRATRVCATL